MENSKHLVGSGFPYSGIGDLGMSTEFLSESDSAFELIQTFKAITNRPSSLVNTPFLSTLFQLLGFEDPIPPKPSDQTAASIQLQVTVENLAPQNGAGFSPLWFALHDGSFDTYNSNQNASPQLELIAEDGITGLEGLFPGVIETSIANGINLSGLPLDVQLSIFIASVLGIDFSDVPPPPSTMAGLFNHSSAGLSGGTQGLALINRQEPVPLLQLPGETNSTPFFSLQGDTESNRYFSYLSMLMPTNDGFFGNDDPKAVEIFDEQGNFLGANFTVLGSQVLDAGTEVNDEEPASIPYTYTTTGNLGSEENSTIQPFPSFLPAGAGGALDFEFNGEKIFANADFTVPDYELARIVVSARITGTRRRDHLNGGLGHDILIGKGGKDRLNGGEGDDTLIGGKGADILVGGAGSDKLTGGKGPDIFVYTSVSDAEDIITDFGKGADAINLRALLDSIDYMGTDPINDGYLDIATGISDTVITVDPDGYDIEPAVTLITLQNYIDGLTFSGGILS